MKPSVVVFSGDPAGIGAEVMAKALSDSEVQDAADYIVVGSKVAIEQGCKSAGVSLPFTHVDASRPVTANGAIQMARWERDDESGFETGKVSAKSGAHMLAGLAYGLNLCTSRIADAMCVAPLNKSALRAGGMRHPDEINYFREVLNFNGSTTEFNVNEKLWTSRVTSHVPLRSVADLLSEDKIISGIRLLTEGLRSAGIAKPRIAVCGLNPHNGEGGAFGREEIDVIAPAVEEASRQGYPAHGPMPADTIFVLATKEKGGFDGVLTMYHDQGQIAMKLMSFGRGVTVHYGLPVPVTTTSHGTAYEIYGQGIATPEAMKNALLLAARMGSRSVVSRPTSA